jgi:hypothetical protein
MTKSEFITFLKEKQEERGIELSHWRQTSSNNDDWWHLYKPFVDWLEDDMCLFLKDVVRIRYNKTLYGNTTKQYDTTYEDFVKNYDKTLG